jgi:hypothetical protein
MNLTRIETGLRRGSRTLIVYVLLFLIAIPVVFAVSVFIFFYSLAILGPWISGKISLKGRFRRAIDLLFGIGSIHEFRDDLKSMIAQQMELEIGDRSAPEIQSDIYDLHQRASDKAERGEFVVAVITGIVSLVVGTLTGTSIIGWLLGTYSVVMTLTIGLHVVILDILAYNRSDDLSPYRREHLLLLEAWNRAILSNHTTQASILAVGVLKQISPTGYEIAKEILKEVVGHDLNRWEQIFFVADAISRIIDGIIRDGL